MAPQSRSLARSAISYSRVSSAGFHLALLMDGWSFWSHWIRHSAAVLRVI